MLEASEKGVKLFRFNPRPPRRTGAIWWEVTFTCGAGMFQSSPAPKDGRYLGELLSYSPVTGFNPRPPRRTGAITRRVMVGQHCLVSILARPEGRALFSDLRRQALCRPVSILARPEGRALLCGHFAGAPGCCRFNPRPPRRTGAICAGHAVETAKEVSILARPEGRALSCGCNLPLRKAYFWVGREPWRAASPRLGFVKAREMIIHKLQCVAVSAKLPGLYHC